MEFIPQSAWARHEKVENLVETILARKVAYATRLKIAWGTWNWTWNPIHATESKKWMQYPSITIPKSFMGNIFPYFFYEKKHCLHLNIGM
jgi:hypothetical protein